MKKLLSIFLCLLCICSQASAALCIRMDEGALLLDRSGEEIIPLGIYKDIIPLGVNRYAVLQGNHYALMDETGALQTDFGYDFFEIHGEILLAEADGLYGLLDFYGNPLTSMEYTRILPVGDGRFWAIRDDGDDLESDELFILDSSGNETATELFIRRMQPTGEGLLSVLRPVSGLWGYCDAEGEMLIPARYSYAGPFLHDRAAVVENGLYGAIDRNGQTILEAGFDYLEVCTGGFILAGLNRQGIWVFDLNGNELACYKGEDISAASVGTGYAVYDAETVTLYSASGEVLIQAGPDAAVTEGLDGQFIIADGTWGEKCVSILGTETVYQNLHPLGHADNNPLYVYMEANSARFINDLLGEVQISVDMDTARYGVVNSQGDILIPAEFESIKKLDDDRLLCHTDDYWQVMDTAGNIYWSHGVRQIEAPNS